MNMRDSRLPEGVEDVLPPHARQLEDLRRAILDMLHAHGYDYVICPVFEYLDSLLVGAGADLELQTFTFTDLKSGRLLGLRADLTSQALRMDASRILESGVLRLCYSGPVARAQPEGVFAMRESQIIGAELFGSDSQSADAEIVALMAGVLELAGITQPFIEVGHVGIVAALVQDLNLDAQQRADLYAALHRKAYEEVRELTQGAGPAGPALVALTDLFGDKDTLKSAHEIFMDVPGKVLQRLGELETFVKLLQVRVPSAILRVDLAEITGFSYHTGLVFAAYSQNSGQMLARGGRYDDLGGRYGRPRPAVGFDVDLARFPIEAEVDARVAWVPKNQPVDEAGLEARRTAIARLREDGWRVVEALSEEEPVPQGTSHRLVSENAIEWQLEPL